MCLDVIWCKFISASWRNWNISARLRFQLQCWLVFFTCHFWGGLKSLKLDLWKRFSSVLETAYQHMKRGSLESLVISCWERELWIHQALDLLHELGLVGHEPKTPARSNKVIQTFKAVFEYWTSVSKFVKLRLKTLNRFKRIEPPSLKASPKNGEKSSLWISWCGSSVNTLPALQLTVWRPFMHFEMQVVYSIFRLAALKICLMEHFW